VHCLDSAQLMILQAAVGICYISWGLAVDYCCCRGGFDSVRYSCRYSVVYQADVQMIAQQRLSDRDVSGVGLIVGAIVWVFCVMPHEVVGNCHWQLPLATATDRPTKQQMKAVSGFVWTQGPGQLPAHFRAG